MNRSVPNIALIATVCLSLLLTGRHAAGTTRLTEDFVDLLKMADAVVEVKVLDLKAAIGSRGFMATTARVSVLRSLKGAFAAGAEVMVEYAGGSDSTTRTYVPSQPVLVLGQKAVLLLSKRGDAWHVVGGDAGEVVFRTDENGAELAQRQFGSFKYYSRDEQSLTGYSAVEQSYMSIERFNDLVGTVIKTGKPVLGDVVASAPQIERTNAVPAIVQAPASHENSLLLPLLVAIGAITGLWTLLRNKTGVKTV